MRLMLRSLVCVFAVAALMVTISADAAQKKKETKGPVAKVDAESITLKIGEKKKDGKVVTPAKEISFKLNADTKVEKAGAKKDDPATPAAVADIKVGATVGVIGAEGGAAEKVVIYGGKKKKDS